MQYTAEEMKWLQDQGIRFLYKGDSGKWQFDGLIISYYVFRPDEDRAERLWIGKFGKKKTTKTPHKHAELIKAWADGEKIQFKNAVGEWIDCHSKFDYWDEKFEYRIKPEIKPDRVFTHMVYNHGDYAILANDNISPSEHNVKFVFDGETNKLKSVEMIGD